MAISVITYFYNYFIRILNVSLPLRNSFIPPCVQPCGRLHLPTEGHLSGRGSGSEIATFVLCSIFCAKSLIRKDGLGVRVQRS